MSESVKPNVFRKLAKARVMLQTSPLKKSGWNDYSKYYYFQLEDFLPRINEIFDELGMVSAFSMDDIGARLLIYDADTGEYLTFKSPIAESTIKGASPIQNLGGVHTYMRRYLWLEAMEIVENDAIDGLSEEQKQTAKKSPKSNEKPREEEDITSALIELNKLEIELSRLGVDIHDQGIAQWIMEKAKVQNLDKTVLALYPEDLRKVRTLYENIIKKKTEEKKKKEEPKNEDVPF